jgi:ribosomal RNA-processing protein 8
MRGQQARPAKSPKTKKSKDKKKRKRAAAAAAPPPAAAAAAPPRPRPPAARPAAAAVAAAAAAAAAAPFVSLSAGRRKSKDRGAGAGGGVLAKMRERLQGGHFRWLNERLYTTRGDEALALMRAQPELYAQYHEGFRRQTEGWPAQPVDAALAWLAARPADWAVADLGCGDAAVAAAAAQRVHSFDLVAGAPGVVACNMAALPLGAAAVDAALFCLSLMGVDYGRFLEEAARVTRDAGWIWVAEVQSRFVGEDGASALDEFVAAVGALGFRLRRRELSNPYFLVLEFQGQKGRRTAGAPRPRWPALRACQYKKR